ncbi:MAG: host attachment protein [Gammaproteobacteria bacterium]|nr:host attachment protein [Gammaproteobacteria bacterium]
MNGIGVVIADDVRARIFRAEGLRGGLEEVATLTHPEARLHERDLVTDDPGQDVSPRGREADRFAREVAHWLEQAVSDGRFRHLVVCAAPKMLGRLRQQLLGPGEGRRPAGAGQGFVPAGRRRPDPQPTARSAVHGRGEWLNLPPTRFSPGRTSQPGPPRPRPRRPAVFRIAGRVLVRVRNADQRGVVVVRILFRLPWAGTAHRSNSLG